MEEVVKLFHVSIYLSFSVTTSQIFINSLWKNLSTSTLERKKKCFFFFTFSKRISSFKDFFLLFPTSYTSYFTLLNIIVLVATRLSICPHLLSVTHLSAFVFFYLVHLLNSLSPVLLETKVKSRIKYSIQSSVMLEDEALLSFKQRRFRGLNPEFHFYLSHFNH